MTIITIRKLSYVVGVAAVLFALTYMYHKIDQGGYNRAVAEYEKRDKETQIKSEELFKRKQHDADIANQQNRERYINAMQIYAQHYDNLRDDAESVPKRVFIRAKTNCSGNTMPGTDKNRSKTTSGTERYGQAELPESNLRKLNAVIFDIEKMQLKCEQLLNSVE